MHRILYISTARAILSADAMQEILRISRRNNDRAGVTGLLVVGGRRFLQALEGPSEAVSETFDRISRDPRHFAVVKLGDQAVAARSFAQWSMGFETGGIAPEGASLAEQVETLVATIQDATLRAYFTGFAKSHSSV
ncbi:hypothetical protein BH10PSE13_BH10PSE13_08640 [soil metagenome]